MLWKPRHFGSLASPAMRLILWASHSLTAGRSEVFVFYRLLSGVTPLLCLRFVPTIFPQGAQGPPTTPSGNTTKITNHFSPSLFHSSFLPTFGTNSLTLFNPILPSRPSKQLFTTISYHPPSNSSIFSTPDNPPKPTSYKFPAFLPESPCSVHLVFPVFPPHPSPFHRSPNVSVPHGFVLPTPAPLVSCPLAVHYVLALIRASTRYTKKKFQAVRFYRFGVMVETH